MKRHASSLRAAKAREDEADARGRLEARLAVISGGAATLWIGGNTPGHVDARKETAENTARSVRGALQHGVLPGGGAALLACRPLLQERAAHSADPDERAAYRILATAVMAPVRALLENAGVEPAEMLAGLEARRTGFCLRRRIGEDGRYVGRRHRRFGSRRHGCGERCHIGRRSCAHYRCPRPPPQSREGFPDIGCTLDYQRPIRRPVAGAVRVRRCRPRSGRLRCHHIGTAAVSGRGLHVAAGVRLTHARRTTPGIGGGIGRRSSRNPHPGRDEWRDTGLVGRLRDLVVCRLSRAGSGSVCARDFALLLERPNAAGGDGGVRCLPQHRWRFASGQSGTSACWTRA